VRETLAASAQTNEPLVLIDKLNQECHILRRGRVVETFGVEMGNSWMERKLTEGDGATPEGRYQIAALKGNGNCRFYKAALLSYPNQADRTRFVKAKRTGAISGRARIGGLIEIHGEGGRGNNWTAGCVSLANADMDRLMSFLRTGTPVTIVGVWQEPSWLSSGGLTTDTAVLPGRAD
jgi:murein L,D-transpeptidase YafK